uniref:caspase family protein n=1 Tax=Tahibacter sp. TaxID=2056211 RepID=UPI0028C3A4E8
MPAVRRCLRLLATILLWLGCGALAAAPAATPGKGQVALVVGIGAYQNAPPLPNPPKDARAVAESLKKLGFQVELAIDPDKTRLEQAVKRFGDQLQGAKVGLFFYAGHGLQVSGRNYLVPADAKIDNERSLPFAA